LTLQLVFFVAYELFVRKIAVPVQSVAWKDLSLKFWPIMC